jgi:hypothetical protein
MPVWIKIHGTYIGYPQLLTGLSPKLMKNMVFYVFVKLKRQTCEENVMKQGNKLCVILGINDVYFWLVYNRAFHQQANTADLPYSPVEIPKF